MANDHRSGLVGDGGVGEWYVEMARLRLS